MASGRDAVINLFWKVHPKLYKWSGGRIGGKLMGLPVLLLTTTGRKSGLPRTKALLYRQYGESFVVIASKLGAPKHPAWWLNLEANPAATLTVGRQQIAVRAREAQDEEREQLWRGFVDAQPAFAEYAAETSRQIPVVVLDRA